MSEIDYSLEELLKATNIQSLIFDRGKFSVAQAKAWASKHNRRNDKVDLPKGGESIRLRQFDPGMCSPNSFATIKLTDGIQAAICTKKGGDMSKSDIENITLTSNCDNATLSFSQDSAIMTGTTTTTDGLTFEYVFPYETGTGWQPNTIPQWVPSGPYTTNIIVKGDPTVKEALETLEKAELEDSAVEHMLKIIENHKKAISREYEFLFTKAGLEEQKVWYVVYQPYTVDSDGHYATPEAIQEACSNFNHRMSKADNGQIEKCIDINHQGVFPDGIDVFQSHIIDQAATFLNNSGIEQTVKPGSWVVGLHVTNPEVWQGIKDGLYDGISMGGYGVSVAGNKEDLA